MNLQKTTYLPIRDSQQKSSPVYTPAHYNHFVPTPVKANLLAGRDLHVSALNGD